MRKTLLLLPSLVALSAGVSNAAFIVIDDFQSQVANLAVQGAASTSGVFDQVAGTILGGERDVFFTSTAVSIAGNNDRSTLDIDEGIVFTNNSAASSHFIITWDGDDNIANTSVSHSSNNAQGLGGVDLTDGGLNGSFSLLVDSVFSPSSNIAVITVTDSSNTTSSLGVTLANLLNTTVDYRFNFNFFTGIDFTSITSISLQIDSSSGVDTDISISSLTAVPEPTSALLLSFAGLGFLARRKRN
jgi:hypothetical protein